MRIVIYTTPTCVFCKLAKAYFQENGIAYEEKNVAADSEARDLMIQKSNQLGVPVVDIDGTIIVGFDKERLGEIISAKRDAKDAAAGSMKSPEP